MKKTTRFTAIQLRDDSRLCCSMVYGKATKINPGMMGKIALVDDGCLVGYHIINGNRERAFLFRADASRGGQKISGIYPAVTLLVSTRSRFRAGRLLAFLRECNESGVSLETFSDDCFHRLNAMLEGRGCSESAMLNMVMQCQD
ncbi:hypothetical protein BIU88_09670 [Chlorobaculum limnaeum]|uniref:Uncharacterized protein n=1 Tax=Chlorobaculum limnaeum TaxID=274537 RepID=A0A1D8D2E6_CHLLM|nr:hypothetical protein [Chlorobaculum limnaeum]AOS84373.1 hypothetical protein BIU88_09670 [Chlorobaculum limnaeum]